MSLCRKATMHPGTPAGLYDNARSLLDSVLVSLFVHACFSREADMLPDVVDRNGGVPLHQEIAGPGVVYTCPPGNRPDLPSPGLAELSPPPHVQYA
jgi:hypothetical protein